MRIAIIVAALTLSAPISGFADRREGEDAIWKRIG